MTNSQNMRINSARIRSTLLRLFKKKNGGHVGGSLSIVEVLSVLYSCFMRFDPKNPTDPIRDYLVLSKGHAGPGLYSALSVFGFFPEESMEDMNDLDTRFPSHPDRLKTPGVDVTTGSLGQGLSLAAGLAYALRLEKSEQYVYTIVGDGELNEGQCWEAIQFIANYHLNRLIMFVDENKRQLDGYTCDVMQPFDIAKKIEAFGFNVQRVDGADEEAIAAAIERAQGVQDRAVCIVLDTIKGQGIPYFEQIDDNHSVKFNQNDICAIDEALAELERIVREG